MKLIITLTAICAAASLFLGITYTMTSGMIIAQGKAAERRAVKIVLPEAEEVKEDTAAGDIKFYKGFDSSGALKWYAFRAEGKGYSSVIGIMVGVDADMNVKGIHILSQQETPGLGARIEEPWFQEQFGKKPLSEVQTITGATISSSAVKRAVGNTVQRFAKVLGGKKG